MVFAFRTYVLPDAARSEFREPLGELIKGNIKESTSAAAKIIKNEKPTTLVLVGDVVSRTIHGQGVSAKVRIIDNRERRGLTVEHPRPAGRTIRVTNQAGTINKAAWGALVEAFHGAKDTLVVVNGEEDLLVLAAVLTAPNGALVVYGQPSEGIVLVRVTENSRGKVLNLLQRMRMQDDP